MSVLSLLASQQSQVFPAISRVTASYYLNLFNYPRDQLVSHMLKTNSSMVFCSDLLPLPQLMVHSLHGLFPLQGSQCYPLLQCTKLLPSPQRVARAILCSMQKWDHCHSLLFCVIFFSSRLLLAALINIWTQSQVEKMYCQAILSSPSLAPRYFSPQIFI